MINGAVQQEDTFVNIYACNIGAPKYIKQMLTDLKVQIDSNTIIVVGFNTSLISVDKSSRQKILKETLALDNTLGQVYLIDMYRTFCPKPECTFFSGAPG